MDSVKHRSQLAADSRSTEQLVDLFLGSPDSEASHEALIIIHARGGPDEFQHGARLARSTSATERIAGADILAQLGWDMRTFLDESVSVLLELLNDASPDVQAAAATALGHRNSNRAVEPLLRLVRHPDTSLRFGIVLGLSRQDDPRALEGLAQLSHDSDRDVRNWATFGLAQQTDADSEMIREILAARAEDSDPEIRGEALIGLARRQDPRALQLVERELAGEFHGDWAVEAAEHIADSRLHPVLESLYARLDDGDRYRFSNSFADALAACSQES